MDIVEIRMVERVVEDHIVIDMLGVAYLAQDAFSAMGKQLHLLKPSRTKISIVVVGMLGRDTVWESFGDYTPIIVVRGVFRKWYSQAVQAQAALVEQLIRTPQDSDFER